MKASIAPTQYQIGAADLETVLAMVRTGTLAAAGERLQVDASTVFRSLQRIERALGQSLFERTRSGYVPLDVALALAEQAEHVESALEAAQLAVQGRPDEVSGTVRITTTDTILHGLVAPTLQALRAAHPLLQCELHAGNELASLTRRDADIAVRATRRPPPHLVGRQLGVVRMALFGAKKGPARRWEEVSSPQVPWIAPDDAMPEHPSVSWRKKHFPKVLPAYRVSSILTVMELVALGVGVGVFPLFLASGRKDLLQLSEELPEARTELWLLAHPESRHLRRVSAAYQHLAEHVRLP